MSVYEVPVVLGVIVILMGLGLLWDSWGPQTIGPMRDRRRRPRAPIDLKGEFVAGVGIVLLGAALIGSDWRFETVTILAGALCVLVGALRNRKYFREVFTFRGAARRDDDPIQPKSGKLRIR
ncbi:MAG TPA: hypothetical protein VN650_14390 [Gemmatimonadaceae bacterium]|nr:hypothetical protein [Gemmatimonadaceae bacterium]